MSEGPSRPRLLIVVNYFDPYVSGVSEYAKALASVCADQCDVTVLTGRHLKSLPSREEKDGYCILRIRPAIFIDKGYLSPKFISAFRRLCRDSDIVNLHFPMLESGLLSMLTKKMPLGAAGPRNLQRMAPGKKSFRKFVKKIMQKLKRSVPIFSHF